MWMKTLLTEILNIRYPIIQAGMAGGITSPSLVASISNAGGLGTIGAGYMTPQQLDDEIGKVAALTERPFGVNLFVPEIVNVDGNLLEYVRASLVAAAEKLEMDSLPLPMRDYSSLFQEQLELVLKHEIKVCSFTFGLPDRDWVKELQKNGTIVMGTATTVREAMQLEEAGMDFIVAQGSEAGGHRGTFPDTESLPLIGTMSLVPQVADHIQKPVIAAGGIMDGRGIMASLILGAAGVQLGTLFLASKESAANPLYKEKVLEADDESTVLTRAFSGKWARGISNEFIKNYQSLEPLPYPVQNDLTQGIRRAAARQKDTGYMSMWAGQSVRLARGGESATQIFASLVKEADLIAGAFQGKGSTEN